MNFTSNDSRVNTKKNVFTSKKKKKKLQRVKLVKPVASTKNGNRTVYLTSENLKETSTTMIISSSSDYYGLIEIEYKSVNDRSIDSAQDRLMSGVNKPDEFEWSNAGLALIALTLIAFLALGVFGLMCFTRLNTFSQVNVDSLEKRPKMDDEKTKKKLKLSGKKKMHRKANREKIVKKMKNVAHSGTKEGSSAVMMKHVQASGAIPTAPSNAADAAEDYNFHEVIVFDTENVLQFDNKDTENRFEMTFGDSKVTVQLFDKNMASNGKYNVVSGAVENEGKAFYDFNALSNSISSSPSSNEDIRKSGEELARLIASMKESILKVEKEKEKVMD